MDPHQQEATRQAEDAAIRREFDAVIRARRSSAGIEAGEGDTWALALSGGGIRSATFCLGLIRALARNRVLKRFDYLSTVSGGGYVGSSLGRLFGEHADAESVEQGVAKDDSTWLWWLRNNGRYLTPAGAKDRGFAAASILRSVLATHLELGLLLVMLAGIVLLPHLLISIDPPTQDTNSVWSTHYLHYLSSFWWWLIPIAAAFGSHQMLVYWFTRERRELSSRVFLLLCAVIGLLLAVWFVRAAMTGINACAVSSEGQCQPAIAWLVIPALIAMSAATAWLSATWNRLRGQSVAAVRLRATKRLSYALWTILALAAIGLLDWGSWRLFDHLSHPRSGATVPSLAAMATLALGIGRFALPEIQRWVASSKGGRINLMKALNILGMLVSATLAVAWTTLFTYLLFRQLNASGAGEESPWELPQVRLWLVVMGAGLLYLLVTRRSYDLLNLSSLHNFYRARIERAYVSSGNDQRQHPGGDARFGGKVLDPVSPEVLRRTAPLMEVVPGDDIALQSYAPHHHGGPVHLVNCCVNQTVDDRTGMYNADRKGIALAVSALGAEWGTQMPDAASIAPGTLSQWVAISGAAASTGMGSRTAPGMAGMLFLSGLRLGYWIRSLSRDVPTRADLQHFLLTHFPKPCAIVAESLARFPGFGSPTWYVSDGGHFDNTGVYALLKRKPEVIVAADCGGDPQYLFADLESLVRKAKIDYGASIEFIDPARQEPALPGIVAACIGTPETIGPEIAGKFIVLGRITYCGGKIGTLIVVKPRRIDDLPFDLVAYADRSPDFPQQSTGDQFFDEAQWEAYHRLGMELGSRLDAGFIDACRRAVNAAGEASSSLLKAENQGQSQAQAKAEEPASTRRDRIGKVVGTTIGAGLSFSLLLAAWQGMEQFRQSMDARAEKRGAQIDKLVQDIRFADFRGDESKKLSAQLERMSSGLGTDERTRLVEALDQRCQSISAESTQAGEQRKACCMVSETVRNGRELQSRDYWLMDVPTMTAPARCIGQSADDRTRDRVPTASTQGHVTQGRDEATARPVAPPPAAVPVITGSMPNKAGHATTDQPSSPASSAGASTAPVASTTPSARSCQMPTAVYLHIYDEASRAAAQRIAASIKSAGNELRVRGIENVTATATAAGGSPPWIWPQPALVVHQGATSDCVDAVGGFMPDNTVRRAIGGSKAQGSVVEVWLPPLSL